MKYKNIVFDFGNVIGKFDGRYMLEQFCSSKKDCDLLYPLIYANWADLDRGLDYEKNARRITSLVGAFKRHCTALFPMLAGTYGTYAGYTGFHR